MGSLAPQLDLPPENPSFPDEITVGVTCHWSLNGKIYGTPDQINLKNNIPLQKTAFDVKFYHGQPNLKGYVQFLIKVGRLQDHADNVYNHKWYYLNITVFADQIEDFTFSASGDFVVPAHFNAPAEFTPEGKVLVSFITRKPLTVGSSIVPPLVNEANRANLESLISDLTSYKKEVALHKFELILDADLAYALPRMSNKIRHERENPVLHAWSFQSPNKHELRKPNILAPEDRPLVKRERVQNVKVSGDRLAFLQPHVYALVDEHNLEIFKAAQIGAQSFQAAFMPVPGSSAKTCLLDNELPKVYLASVVWDTVLMKRPKEGEIYTFVLPFEVPDCAQPPEDQRRPARKGPHPVFEDDDGVDEHGEFITVRETNEEKNDAILEKQEEDRQYKRHCWMATVLPPSELNANAQPLFIMYRPVDNTYQGLDKSEAPTVGTLIPVIETRIDELQRIRDLLGDKTILRQTIKIFENVSESTFNDLLRGLNDFVQLQDDLKAITTSLACHMAEFIITGDKDLPYQEVILKDHCAEDVLSYAADLTSSQRDAFENIVSNPSAFRHGVHLIAGVPAAGKSLILERVIAAWTQKFKDGEHVHQPILFCTDGNVFANEAAARLVDTFQKMGKKIIRAATLIRVGAWSTEEDMFTSEYTNRVTREYFQGDIQVEYAVQEKIEEVAKAAYAKRSIRDKRLDPNLISLSLADAMKQYIVDHPSDKWEDLRAKLTKRRDNPMDSTNSNAEINMLMTELRDKTLRGADIIVTTCGMALRPWLKDAIAPVLLIKDEDCQSAKWNFISLLSTYFKSLGVGILSGDQEQKIPHLETLLTPDIPAAFAYFPRYTAFILLQDLGCEVTFLRVQFRMFNYDFVNMLSTHRYNSTMVDGNKGKNTPPEVKMIRDFFNNELQIDSNVGMVRCENSYPSKLEGSTSTVNLGLQTWLVGLLKRFFVHLDAWEDRHLNKAKFTVQILSPYAGVINWLQNRLNVLFKGRKISIIVINVSQGTSASLSILVHPAKFFSDFAGNPRDDLVASTRWRYGFLRVVPIESTLPSSYRMENEVGMLNTYRSRMNTQQFLFFKKLSWITDVKAEEGRLCSKCHREGHMKDRCPIPTTQVVCGNCYKPGHESKACDRPKNYHNQDWKVNTVVCHKCHEEGHVARECKSCRHCGVRGHQVDMCPHPWCSECKAIGHDRSDCPKSYCTKCNTTGEHWSGSARCPLFNICFKCGGKHDHKRCTAPPSTAGIFPGNFLTGDAEQDSARDRALHQKLNPELYINYQIESDEEIEIRLLARLNGVSVEVFTEAMVDIYLDENTPDEVFRAIQETSRLDAHDDPNGKLSKMTAVSAEHGWLTFIQKAIDNHNAFKESDPDNMKNYSQLINNEIVFFNDHKISKNHLPLPYGTDISYIVGSNTNPNDSGFFSLPPQTTEFPLPGKTEERIVQCKGGLMLHGLKWQDSQGNDVLSFSVPFERAKYLDELSEGITYSAMNFIVQDWSIIEFQDFLNLRDATDRLEKDRVDAGHEVALDGPVSPPAWGNTTSVTDAALDATPASTWNDATPASTNDATPASTWNDTSSLVVNNDAAANSWGVAEIPTKTPTATVEEIDRGWND